MKKEAIKFTRLSAIGILLILGTIVGFAQNLTVKGTVKDTSGEPVLGATVVVEGKSGMGTATDINGVSRKTQLQPLSPYAHNFISICYLCIMKTEQLLRCIFPEILADYFDVIDIQESISQIDFWLDERNFMEEADRKAGTVSSYGFTAERVVQDFPLRGKPVYLHVRRRKWRDSSTGEIFSYSYDDLTAEGSKLSPEFVSFLKE